MTREFSASPKYTGRPFAPYVIAEVGVNHGGNLDLATRLIDEASEAGANAVKFQTYKAETIASQFSPAYWDLSKEPTRSQYELFKKYDAFGPKEYEKLARRCSDVGVDFLSTPFDTQAVDFLALLVPFYKVASADITNLPLLRRVAAKGKPVVLSTGASSLAEIEHAIELLSKAGSPEVSLLHCVLEYPTPIENAQLDMISVLSRSFPEVAVGYSDHVTPGEDMPALEVAVLLGATVLEKHFTHDKSLPGNDHYHAMDRRDLKHFLKKVAEYRTLIGPGGKDLSLEADARHHARRSIVAACAIKAGELFSERNLIPKRPAHGISPLYWDDVIGKTASRDIEYDRPLVWKDVGD